jgi:hypothetical protein
MKLHTTQNNVVKSGSFEESNFSIEASAKAFFILSDGLYSNKIKAVIRELSTNAYDSQVDAGNQDLPFDVHLPTRLEPTFYVRDYGTGMSHEDCMQLYTTYFRSTRNDSNESVGCLGLGSKAPFAYCDQFNVESYQDGVVRTYTAYQSEDGTPVFSLMDEQSTEEPNGLKITVAVKEDDMRDFSQEAENLYRYFTTKPNVLGEELVYPSREVKLAGDGWSIVDAKYPYNGNIVIMGQIAYPFSKDDIYGSEPEYSGEWSAEEKFLSESTGLEIEMEIGQVDITPSREHLSFNKTTINALKARVSEVKKAVVDDLQDRINEAETLFQARVLYTSLSKRCGSIKSLSDGLDDLKWNGQELFDWFDRGVFIQEETDEGTKAKIGASVTLYHKSNWRTTPEVTRNLKKVVFQGNFTFVIDDTKRGGIGRLKLYIAENTNERDSHTFYLIKGSPEQIEEAKTLLGGADGSDFLYTSCMEKPISNSSNRSYSSHGSSPKAMVFDHEECSFVAASMSVKTENAYYLTESRGYVDYNGGERGIVSISKILCAISGAGYDISDMKIYLVKPSVARNSKLSERENWSEASEVLVYILKELLEENFEKIEQTKNIAVLSKEYKSSRVAEVLEKLELDCEIKDLYNAYKENKKRVDEFGQAMENLYSACKRTAGLRVPEVSGYSNETNDDQFSSKVDAIIKDKYMLFGSECESGWGDFEEPMIEELVNYIVMKETCL